MWPIVAPTLFVLERQKSRHDQLVDKVTRGESNKPLADGLHFKPHGSVELHGAIIVGPNTQLQTSDSTVESATVIPGPVDYSVHQGTPQALALIVRMNLHPQHSDVSKKAGAHPINDGGSNDASAVIAQFDDQPNAIGAGSVSFEIWIETGSDFCQRLRHVVKRTNNATAVGHHRVGQRQQIDGVRKTDLANPSVSAVL